MNTLKRKPKGSIEASSQVISVRVPHIVMKDLKKIAKEGKTTPAGVIRDLLYYYLMPYQPDDLIREFITMDFQGKIPGGIIERYRNLLKKMGPHFEQYKRFYDRYLHEKKKFDELERECKTTLERLHKEFSNKLTIPKRMAE
ncbi:MAG: hypothetical protein ACE144_13920 [Thermodesulfobacteriota bacterium]